MILLAAMNPLAAFAWFCFGVALIGGLLLVGAMTVTFGLIAFLCCIIPGRQ